MSIYLYTLYFYIRVLFLAFENKIEGEMDMQVDVRLKGKKIII